MSEHIVPEHDYVVLRQIAHEDKTASGLIIPQAGLDYDNLKSDANRTYTPQRDIVRDKQRNTNRYEVLAAGPGLYVDVADDLHDAVFLRKPMCCKKGDIVMVQEGALPVPVDGDIVYVCHDWNVLAQIIIDDDGKEKINVFHDYIMFKQAENVQKSKGGIYLAGQSDFTGNQALPDRYEVLGVGDGPWCLRQEKGKIPEFARRPMSVKQGDIFAFEGAGFYVSAAGALMGVCQNYQIACKFVNDSESLCAQV